MSGSVGKLKSGQTASQYGSKTDCITVRMIGSNQASKRATLDRSIKGKIFATLHVAYY